MKIATIFTVLFSVPTLALASTTICKLEETISGPIKISWDDATLEAKIIYPLNEMQKGVVTLIRKEGHNSVNIFVKYEKPLYRGDAEEYLIFPRGDNYRVIVVGYILRDGKKFLSSGGANYSATCLSI